MDGTTTGKRTGGITDRELDSLDVYRVFARAECVGPHHEVVEGASSIVKAVSDAQSPVGIGDWKVEDAENVLARIAREQAKRIEVLTREAEALKRELGDLIRTYRPELLKETGCGPLTAAILIGQTAGAERFESDAHFARMAGVAPVPVSSGRQDRHCLDRGGKSRQVGSVGGERFG